MNNSPAGELSGPAIERLHERYGGSVDRALRRVNAWLHGFAGLTMVLLMFWTVADIASRALFSSPFRGTVELTELAVVVLVYLGLARAENQDAHIAVNLLFVRLGERAQLATRAFAGIVTVLVVALMTWRMYIFAGQLDSGGHTTGVLGAPLYPVAMAAVAGSAAFGLAALSNVIVCVRALLRER